MARAVIGGLISSTVLTLVVVPVVYTYLDSLGEFFTRKFAPKAEPHDLGQGSPLSPPPIHTDAVVELTPLPMPRPMSQTDLGIVRDGDALRK